MGFVSYLMRCREICTAFVYLGGNAQRGTGRNPTPNGLDR